MHKHRENMKSIWGGWLRTVAISHRRESGKRPVHREQVLPRHGAVDSGASIVYVDPSYQHTGTRRVSYSQATHENRAVRKQGARGGAATIGAERRPLEQSGDHRERVAHARVFERPLFVELRLLTCRLEHLDDIVPEAPKEMGDEEQLGDEGDELQGAEINVPAKHTRSGHASGCEASRRW